MTNHAIKSTGSRAIPVIIFLFFLLGASWFIADRSLNPTKEKIIKINGKSVAVEIADTPGKRSRGLSGRTRLAENQGMLFVFEESGYHPFWMKDMLIPLDFIWIEKGRILEITENIKLEDYPPPKYLASKYNTDAVLEIAAGSAKKLNLKAGDKVNY